MAIRTALLNGNVINRDTDFSKYIETVSEAGVIEGLAVSSSSVAIGKCRVPCERTNGDKIFALVYVSTAQSISGDGDVYVKVSQEIIDNGELWNEDWTGIATIEVGTMPSKNALKLAVITSGEVEDKRNMIKKVGELNTAISSLDTRMTTAEGKIDVLEEKGAVDRLEDTALVGELYNFTDKLFKQKIPNYSISTIDANVWDVNANKEIHIQRIANGTATNKINLKIKSVGSPTTWLVIEVRKWVKVTLSESYNAYWYGDEVLCSWSIGYSEITNNYQEFEVTMSANFWGTKGELLDVVVYQTGSIVNASNYYCIACDSSQFSQAFGYVSVNGTDREKSNLMPYCMADWFTDKLLCKIATSAWYVPVDMTMINTYIQWDSQWATRYDLFTATETGYYRIQWDVNHSNYSWWVGVKLSWWTLVSWIDDIYLNDMTHYAKMDCILYVTAGTTVKWCCQLYSYGNGNWSNFSAQLLKYYDLPYWWQWGTGGTYEKNTFSYSNSATGSITYTTTKAYDLLYLVLDWNQSNSHQWWWGWASLKITVWNDIIFNKSLSRDEWWSQTFKLTNVANSTTIKLDVVAPDSGYTSYTSSIYWVFTISANQTTVIRPLLPKEVVEIWKQTSAISYWRLDDWTWYGDFDWEVYTSATTGSVTLWNCIWFKVIEDSSGFRYKIPIYWL